MDLTSFRLQWPFLVKNDEEKIQLVSNDAKKSKTAIIWQIFQWKRSYLVDFHAKITKNEQMWTKISTNLLSFWSKMSFSLENLYFVAVKCYFWTKFYQLFGQFLGENDNFTWKFTFSSVIFKILDLKCFSADPYAQPLDIWSKFTINIFINYTLFQIILTVA